MLEKLPGNPRLDKLRVIHIFDALWNAGLGIIWSRRLMPQCEKYKVLHNGQWGSRKGKKAIDCVFQVTYELSRYTHTDLVAFDIDAKSCYDCIVMANALACCCHAGLPSSIIRAFGTFLDFAKYHFKTRLGVSTQYYQHGLNGIPLHGPGQGSQPGPPLWAIQSSRLMKAVSDRFKGVDTCDPYLSNSANHVLQSFVDDVANATNKLKTTLSHFHCHPYSSHTAQQFLHTLIFEATTTVQWWEHVFWTSGGKIEFNKCFLYILHWQFHSNGTPFLAPLSFFQQQHLTVCMVDSDTSAPANLAQMDCTTASCTLGCMIAPNGQTTAETHRLCSKSTKLATALASHHVSRHEGWVFYHSIYLPSLTYTLPAAHLTESQCRQIHRTASASLLHACGYPRHFPFALTYLPQEFGGVGFCSLYAEQGALHITSMLLPHGRSRCGILKQSLENLVKWAHLYSGFRYQPFHDPQLRAPHLPSGCIASTREFLGLSGFSVYWTISPEVPPRRHFDHNIMETACSGPWTSTQIQHINNC